MSLFGPFEDPPAVWGVGRVVVGETIVPWRVSAADVDDEAEALAPRLAALGLDADGLVLIVSLLSETIHVAPLERAAGILSALYSSADATPFDAFRTASLVRQLRPTVVLGVNAALLDGLEDQGRDLADVFAGVRAVVASEAAAVARLAAAGVHPRRCVMLGPTSALQALDDDALAYDAARWEVEATAHGELALTSLAPRLTPCSGFRTGVHGRVLEPGRLTLA